MMYIHQQSTSREIQRPGTWRNSSGTLITVVASTFVNLNEKNDRYRNTINLTLKALNDYSTTQHIITPL